MEVDGKEFMRNVGIEQDKERLLKEQKRLEALKREAYIREEEQKAEQQRAAEEAAFADLTLNNGSMDNLSTPPSNPTLNNEDSIEDIKLESEDPNKTKRKYILLGIALILVFVITILVIRVLSNNDTEQKMENLNPQHKELATDKILDKIDTNEEYQKALELNKAKEEVRQKEEAGKAVIPDVAIGEEKVNNIPLVIETPKSKEEPKKDLFGLNKNNESLTAKKVETAVKTDAEEKLMDKPKKSIADIYKRMEQAEQKQQTVTQKTNIANSKTVEKTVTKASPKKSTTAIVSGYYIQIGAFTKQPGNKLLNEVESKGFSYVIHPMVVKGTKYNKVLIGPYPTKTAAKNNLNTIKQQLKKPSAYVLKF
jgi:DedD protein